MNILKGLIMLERIFENEFKEAFSVMEESFPSDEMRGFDGQRALLKRENYRLYALKKEGEITGIAAVWELDGFYFLEHLAVKKAFRNNGIGTVILKELKSKYAQIPVLEAEPPVSELQKRRVAFYGRNGFVLNPYYYFQPPLEEGKRKVELKIMTGERGLNREEFEKVRALLYSGVYSYKG